MSSPTPTVSLTEKLDGARELRELIRRHHAHADEARQLAHPVVEAMARARPLPRVGPYQCWGRGMAMADLDAGRRGALHRRWRGRLECRRGQCRGRDRQWLGLG